MTAGALCATSGVLSVENKIPQLDLLEFGSINHPLLCPLNYDVSYLFLATPNISCIQYIFNIQFMCLQNIFCSFSVFFLLYLYKNHIHAVKLEVL